MDHRLNCKMQTTKFPDGSLRESLCELGLIDKHIHTVIYYLAMKRNELRSHKNTWIDLNE